MWRMTDRGANILRAGFVLAVMVAVQGDSKTLWSQWWTYEGISGPDYWGLLNQDWSLCSRGQHQSPVDINPRNLVFDPNLRPVRLDAHRVNGTVVNTGHDITFYINDTDKPFAFTGGPLSYTYRVHQIKLHFGKIDQLGSEHTVGGRPFPLEVQVYGFNSELYATYKDAQVSSHGIAALTIFGIIGEKSSTDLENFVQVVNFVPFKDNSSPMSDFSIKSLLPDSYDYMTYEGSMTQPSCLETVTWILLNKPVSVRKDQLIMLRKLHEAVDTGSPPLLMENNFRPPMPVNRRTIRTNIQPQKTTSTCNMQKLAFYEVNDRYRVR
ncbi:Carbonic anhydrase- protein 10 [Bulinus truncatus]|nr:Carbonic anhydrase- protein 10 [Bulinus truncatus]